MLTIAAVAAVLALAAMVIVPGVEEAVTSIAAQAPQAFARLQESAVRFQEYLPALTEQIESLSIDWQSLSKKAIELAQSWGRGLLVSGSGLVSGIVSGVTTFFIGFIFALYILLQKEKLARQDVYKRQISTRPPIIMADEPTGALDSRTGHEVLGFLQQLNKEGSTVILITHDNGIAATARRIVRIADGKIIEDHPQEVDWY